MFWIAGEDKTLVKNTINNFINRYLSMKYFLLILIFIPFLFYSQTNTFKLDSLIMGEWGLIEVEIIPDTLKSQNGIKTGKSREQKLRITKDSIHVDKEYFLYQRIEEQRHFSYKLQFDSIIKTNNLFLYEGEKKKQKEVNSFEIIECNFEKLVLKEYNRLTKNIKSASFYTIYTYKKKNNTTFSSDLLKGKWFSCTDFSFLSPKDLITYEFTRIDSTENCWESTSIEFKTRHFSNGFSIMNKSWYEGVFSPFINYLFDFENKLLYVLLNSLTLAYSVDLINDKLLLKLNREVTEKMNLYSDSE